MNSKTITLPRNQKFAPYQRVIPRDLFNEAKLLNCIGRVVLLVLDSQAPATLTHSEPAGPFAIRLLHDGSLTIENLVFYIKGREVLLKTTYNSKEKFPLFCEINDEEYLVFHEDGQLTEDFLELCR